MLPPQLATSASIPETKKLTWQTLVLLYLALSIPRLFQNDSSPTAPNDCSLLSRKIQRHKCNASVFLKGQIPGTSLSFHRIASSPSYPHPSLSLLNVSSRRHLLLQSSRILSLHLLMPLFSQKLTNTLLDFLDQGVHHLRQWIMGAFS